ncbi:MAG TPA: hypothetical protein VLX68_08510 [Chitinivibrionales bacterium]|nr:hypothetical protein [Chitinivibrionales bacterium]
MIRINLLKGPSRHAGPAVGKILLIAVIVVAVGAAGAALWMWGPAMIAAITPAPKTAEKQDAAPVIASVNSSLVRDVVREVAGERRALPGAAQRIPYAELSITEKINYEMRFAANVAELLDRTVPPGVGLHAFEANNFQAVYAAGIAPSKELVQGMLASLKAQKVSLLPKPLTVVTPGAAGGFKFTVTGTVDFGLSPADSLIVPPFTVAGEVPAALREMTKLAKENAITIVKAPARVSSETVGAYSRQLYQWTGQGPYKNFVKFLLRMRQAGQVCAFKRLAVSALSPASVKIESQVLVTTRQ